MARVFDSDGGVCFVGKGAEGGFTALKGNEACGQKAVSGIEVKLFPVFLCLILMLTLLITPIFSGCKDEKVESEKGKDVPTTPEAKELPVKTLAHGMVSQYGRGDEFPSGEEARPECEVITSAEELEMLLRVIQPQEALPPVDLERQLVLAVLQGPKKTGGYAVSISRVSQKGSLVEVEVVVMEPEPGSITIQILTSPYHLVALDREDFDLRGELRFVFLDDRGNLLEEVLAKV